MSGSGGGGGGNRRRGGPSGSDAGLFVNVLFAAGTALAGAAMVEHAQAQAEGRPSIVERVGRWITEDVLGEVPSGGAGPSAAGAGARRPHRHVGRRLSAAEVAALPTREYGAPATAREEDQHKTFCPICQEAFQGGDKLLRLPCMHEMHAECIADYLCNSERPICPICRHPCSHFG